MDSLFEKGEDVRSKYYLSNVNDEMVQEVKSKAISELSNSKLAIEVIKENNPYKNE